MTDFHGVNTDGTTFGMNVTLSNISGKKFKKEVHKETMIDCFGNEFEWWVCDAVYVAALMGEAGWLVTEGYIYKFNIDSFLEGDDIYIKHGEKISFKKGE